MLNKMMITGSEEKEEVDVFRLDVWKCPEKYMVFKNFLESIPF